MVSEDVDISVGLAHVGEVSAVKDQVTTLNWHSYNGIGNGAGLSGEIQEIQKYVNKFNPPKQMVITEWLARPAQPLASAYPVLRDNKVAAYNWALTLMNCTTKWANPVAHGDPPFQGMIWPNGTVYDDLEEGECMRTQCRTVEYAHHCCNEYNNSALDQLWAFSDGDWATQTFGRPVFKNPGPREGSLRQTNKSSSFTISPVPEGTQRVALYLPTSDKGAGYTISLDGREAMKGTTESADLNWVGRVVLKVGGAKTLKLTMAAAPPGMLFNVSGVTFFSTP